MYEVNFPSNTAKAYLFTTPLRDAYPRLWHARKVPETCKSSLRAGRALSTRGQRELTNFPP